MNNLNSILDLRAGPTPETQSFTFDVLDRLEHAAMTGHYGTLDYTYDKVGNRQTRTEDTGAGPVTDTYGYDPASQRLLSITGSNAQARGYDAVGNTTSIGNRTFIYGDHNRLVEVQENSATVATYVVNGQGQRVVKTTNGETTVFHYDQAGLLIAETDALGETVREYVYLNGEPLAFVQHPDPMAAMIASPGTQQTPLIAGFGGGPGTMMMGGTPADLTLTVDAPEDTGQYGQQYGPTNYGRDVVAEFSGATTDLYLRVTGFDIDFS